MTHTALIIDDEADIRELIAMSLDRIGLNTYTASNLEEARNLLAIYKFDVCLTDMKLPDGNGLDFVRHVQSVQPDLPVAVITAHGNMNAAVEAMKNGAFDFVSKPVDIGLLRSLVTQAIKFAGGKGGEPLSSITQETSTADRSGATQGEIASLKSPVSVLSGASSDVHHLHSATKQQSQEYTGKQTTSQKDSTLEVSSSANSLAQLSGRRAVLTDPFVHIGSGRLIGRSEPMDALRRMIAKVARTNAPVWITGESGTGKELIARLIHEIGPRADAPFIAINCGAIPSELMESEMFGHRKGSFTGAHSNHDGLFKRADRGTLFLDEVAELPLHMQVKLLRAIQERTVRPVGSSDEIKTNVRVLSASHKDLANEVEQGRFRHDLYYRLNVICIKSPSLRQRCNDVPEIARHILKSITKSEALDICATLTPEAEDLLCSYSFPGNVRELENILERAVALSDDSSIQAGDLDIDVDSTDHSNQIEQFDHSTVANHSSERRAILEMLSQTRWNRKEAAKLLGLTYRQLRYRIQQYRIDEDDRGS